MVATQCPTDEASDHCITSPREGRETRTKTHSFSELTTIHEKRGVKFPDKTTKLLPQKNSNLIGERTGSPKFSPKFSPTVSSTTSPILSARPSPTKIGDDHSSGNISSSEDGKVRRSIGCVDYEREKPAKSRFSLKGSGTLGDIAIGRSGKKRNPSVKSKVKYRSSPSIESFGDFNKPEDFMRALVKYAGTGKEAKISQILLSKLEEEKKNTVNTSSVRSFSSALELLEKEINAHPLEEDRKNLVLRKIIEQRRGFYKTTPLFTLKDEIDKFEFPSTIKAEGLESSPVTKQLRSFDNRVDRVQDWVTHLEEEPRVVALQRFITVNVYHKSGGGREDFLEVKPKKVKSLKKF
eukprot:CAMPEP_0115043458 /NCGR_PEP_ID=MMETSP0216-20121206/46884_1 /TAXON_ID=223996 /ORGANISM="Protocruzia adherens, Strain Boccale" /LENGTH=350 /DNA_ID=CAMNT_0002425789 /DNA_START=383 /DNA_END=1435 /DNA_ORIENTATION=-